jgi:hypothetical protein
MEGVLKRKTQQTSSLLVRPWGEGWQSWRESNDADGLSSWKLQAEAPTPDSLTGPECIFILPARMVCSLLSWAPQGDDALVFDSAQLQMEVAGLVNSQTDPLQLDFAMMQREEDRCLVRSLLFPGDYPAPLRSDYLAFLPSPLALALPPHALCLWREGSSMVACVTGEHTALVWESCPLPDGPAALHGWLETFLLELRANLWITKLEKLCDFTGTIQNAELLGLSVEQMQSAPPVPPSRRPAWSPPGVLQSRLRVQRRRHLTRGLLAAAAIVTFLGLAMGGYFLSREWQLRSLRAQVDALSVEVDPAIAIARQWELLAPSIDPDGFALEKLLLAVNALPGDGVRLSLFEALPETVRIEGDARNVGLATLYFNSLQALEGAEKYSWNMPSPVLQPDNSARFAIDGTRQQ